MNVVFHNTVEELDPLLKKEKNVSVFKRINAVIHAMRGYSAEHTAEEVNLSPSNVHTWVNRYNYGNCNFKDRPRSGRPSKITLKKKKK